MRQKYWKSNKPPESSKQQQRRLELIIELANADLNSSTGSDLVSMVNDFIVITTPEDTKQYKDDFIQEPVTQAKKMVSSDQSDELTAERFTLLTAVQANLIDRIQKIVDASTKKKTEPFLVMNMKLKVNISPIGISKGVTAPDIFFQEFQFQGSDTSKSIVAISRLIDLCLLELIVALDLKPSYFKKCAKCEAFFYQPTKREKIYCSQRCANSNRHKRFMDNKKSK